MGAGRSTLIVHHEQVAPSTGPLSQMVEAPSQAVAGILEFLEVPLDRRRLACLPYIAHWGCPFIISQGMKEGRCSL